MSLRILLWEQTSVKYHSFEHNVSKYFKYKLRDLPTQDRRDFENQMAASVSQVKPSCL